MTGSRFIEDGADLTIRPTYTRIRVDGKTLILRDMRTVTFMGEQCVSGIEVDREGNEPAPSGVDQRQHIIQASLITRQTPLKWNNHYGTLEAA